MWKRCGQENDKMDKLHSNYFLYSNSNIGELWYYHLSERKYFDQEWQKALQLGKWDSTVLYTVGL